MLVGAAGGLKTLTRSGRSALASTYRSSTARDAEKYGHT